MRVRIKALDTMSKSEQKELNKYIYEKAMEIYDREMLGCMGRCYKIFVTVLHIKYGFGKKRIMDILKELNSVSKERHKDLIFWQHIDNVVINGLKIDLPRENYEEMGE